MNNIISEYFNETDELICGNCDWWGDPEELEVINTRPACPRCHSDDVFDVTENMGRML